MFLNERGNSWMRICVHSGTSLAVKELNDKADILSRLLQCYVMTRTLSKGYDHWWVHNNVICSVSLHCFGMSGIVTYVL